MCSRVHVHRSAATRRVDVVDDQALDRAGRAHQWPAAGQTVTQLVRRLVTIIGVRLWTRSTSMIAVTPAAPRKLPLAVEHVVTAAAYPAEGGADVVTHECRIAP